MKNDADINMYKGLASYILPDGVLEYFDVVDFVEEPTPEEMPSAKPNGFTEESHILDFPIRDRKTILHVRRRRWTTADGHNYIVPLESITHTKTQYSKELALFLKAADGQ